MGVGGCGGGSKFGIVTEVNAILHKDEDKRLSYRRCCTGDSGDGVTV